jgi:arsenite methyltransferase
MSEFSQGQRKAIEEGIWKRYSRAAHQTEGLFRYPTGLRGLRNLKYDESLLNLFPESVLDCFCGVGNPFSTGEIKPGESVLDVGCGCGVDTLVAASMVGPEGRAVGIDLTSEMVERATENLSHTHLTNAHFQEGSAEDLPFPDPSFDVVISSGAFNLVPDKLKALREVFRVLKPTGRFMIADQVLTGPLPDDAEGRIKCWAG